MRVVENVKFDSVKWLDRDDELAPIFNCAVQGSNPAGGWLRCDTFVVFHKIDKDYCLRLNQRMNAL